MQGRGYMYTRHLGRSKDRYLYMTSSCIMQARWEWIGLSHRREDLVYTNHRWCGYICLWEEQIGDTTTVNVTLWTSFGSGEIPKFEDTVVAGIQFSLLNKYVTGTLTPPPPSSPKTTDLDNSVIWRISCNYMYNLATQHFSFPGSGYVAQQHSNIHNIHTANL